MARSKHKPATPRPSTKFVGVTPCPVQCRRGITVYGHEFVGGEESILAVDELSPAAFAWLTTVPTMTLVEYEKKPKPKKRPKPTTPIEAKLEPPDPSVDSELSGDLDTPFDSEL